MKNKIKSEFEEFKLLMDSVPSVLLTMFVISIFAMNLLANKSINLPFSWLALDCGIIVSWFSFLTMDVITAHFGPKGATQLSVFAVVINLAVCGVFFIGSNIPGVWGESDGEAMINTALDHTFGGTWYILLGSTIAFIVSAFINNFLNHLIGKAFHKNPDGLGAYIARAYISTSAGQFADNLTFALIVSHVFFGWSLLQCVTCALTGMVAELICEAVFSFFGFKICGEMKKNGVGREYLEHMEAKKKERTA